MNYNRRATRPDSLFYRDQRKIRQRGRGPSPRAFALFAALAVVAFIIYLMLR